MIGPDPLEHGRREEAQRSRVIAICESPTSKMTSPSSETSWSFRSTETARSRANAARSKANGGVSRSAAKEADGSASASAARCSLPLRRPPPSGPSAQIKKYAAAQRTLGRYVANDEAVMSCCCDRPIKNELDVGRFSRSDRLVVEQDDARAGFRRGMMKSDWEPLTDRLFLGWQDSDARVDAIGWRVQFGIERHVAASDRVFCYARAGEIERAALARMRRLGRAVLRMKRAHAREQAGWAELDPVADMDRARQHRPGRHDPDARQREDAIDRKPKPLACRPIARRARRLFEMRAQRVHALRRSAPRPSGSRHASALSSRSWLLPAAPNSR